MHHRVRALGAAMAVGAAVITLQAPSATAAGADVERCLSDVASKPHPNREVRRTDNTVAITEYLPAGSYRSAKCDASGNLISSVTAEPHRLPDGTISVTPSGVWVAFLWGSHAIVPSGNRWGSAVTDEIRFPDASHFADR